MANQFAATLATSVPNGASIAQPPPPSKMFTGNSEDTNVDELLKQFLMVQTPTPTKSADTVAATSLTPKRFPQFPPTVLSSKPLSTTASLIKPDYPSNEKRISTTTQQQQFYNQQNLHSGDDSDTLLHNANFLNSDTALELLQILAGATTATGNGQSEDLRSPSSHQEIMGIPTTTSYDEAKEEETGGTLNDSNLAVIDALLNSLKLTSMTAAGPTCPTAWDITSSRNCCLNSTTATASLQASDLEKNLVKSDSSIDLVTSGSGIMTNASVPTSDQVTSSPSRLESLTKMPSVHLKGGGHAASSKELSCILPSAIMTTAIAASQDLSLPNVSRDSSSYHRNNQIAIPTANTNNSHPWLPLDENLTLPIQNDVTTNNNNNIIDNNSAILPNCSSSSIFFPDGSLNLELFKVFPCRNESYVHDRKNCSFYHSQRDRRRHPSLYKAEQCDDHFDLDDDHICRCPSGDQCDKCHNRHELLYHPAIYKQRFCSSYSHLSSLPIQCHRGQFCAFAHTRAEIRCQLFSEISERNPQPMFFMLEFKTYWCPYGTQHDWHGCLYAHTYQDCRRSPKIGYGSEPCPYWQKDLHSVDYRKRCPYGTRCPYSHGSKEQLYHPAYYKTMPCADYKAKRVCPRGHLCAFYHEVSEKHTSSTSATTPPNSQLNSPSSRPSTTSTTTTTPEEIAGSGGIMQQQYDYSRPLPNSLMAFLQKNFMCPPLFNLDDFEAFGHASRVEYARRNSHSSASSTPMRAGGFTMNTNTAATNSALRHSSNAAAAAALSDPTAINAYRSPLMSPQHRHHYHSSLLSQSPQNSNLGRAGMLSLTSLQPDSSPTSMPNINNHGNSPYNNRSSTAIRNRQQLLNNNTSSSPRLAMVGNAYGCLPPPQQDHLETHNAISNGLLSQKSDQLSLGMKNNNGGEAGTPRFQQQQQHTFTAERQRQCLQNTSNRHQNHYVAKSLQKQRQQQRGYTNSAVDNNNNVCLNAVYGSQWKQ